MSHVGEGPLADSSQLVSNATSLYGLLARGSVRKPFAIYPFLQCELQRATNGLLPAARLPAYVTVSPLSLPYIHTYAFIISCLSITWYRDARVYCHRAVSSEERN